ncbi:hypothetical protein SDJN02_15744 [Cucurbita argyrosperma subsp. argyrosperma]|nr:hypothetical protein SDJN02_15744 [Cucurbita argyrosperma subsp. argyrosperma]
MSFAYHSLYWEASLLRSYNSIEAGWQRQSESLRATTTQTLHILYDASDAISSYRLLQTSSARALFKINSDIAMEQAFPLLSAFEIRNTKQYTCLKSGCMSPTMSLDETPQPSITESQTKKGALVDAIWQWLRNGILASFYLIFSDSAISMIEWGGEW